MAHVFDTRGSGGELVVLGEAFTLPSSNSTTTNPLQGSLRFNPISNVVELYVPSIMQWEPLIGNTVSNTVVTVPQMIVSSVNGLFVLFLSNTALGTPGYATDGRKPNEFYYSFGGRIPLSNTVGSGCPVVVGFLDDANAITNTVTWLSTLDGNIVSN